MAYIDHPLTKWVEEYVVQAKYEGRWEDVCYENDQVEARQRLGEYRLNDYSAQDTRMITRKEPNPYYGRIKVGMFVKVAAWSDAFMAGVTSGRVVKVGRKHVHVRWNLNPEVVLKFPPEHLLPETEWED